MIAMNLLKTLKQKPKAKPFVLFPINDVALNVFVRWSLFHPLVTEKLSDLLWRFAFLHNRLVF
jgi:hypothetical protein